MKLATLLSVRGPMRSFTTLIGSPASARRARRCPAVALDGAACAALRLPCAARLEGVPHNSLRSLRSLRSNRMRQVRLRSSLRSPPSRLCCSAPHTAPPPGTACREFPRCALSHKPPTPEAKGCPGGAGRAYEAPRSAGAMAREHSEPRKHFWRILFERSERSERSELCAGPWTRCTEPGHKQSSGLFVPGEGPGLWPGPQGSRSAAQAASSARLAPPGQPFAATELWARTTWMNDRLGPRPVVWTPRFSCVTAWAKWKGPRACGC